MMRDDKARYTLRLAEESRYTQEQLIISHPTAKLIVMAGDECLGVASDVAEDAHKPVDLAYEVPALNYGPTYQALIERTLAAHEDAKALADVLLNNASGYRRSFKLLEIYARDYFARGPFSGAKTTKLAILLIEGTGRIEKDTWYVREQQKLMISDPSFITARGMLASQIEELLVDTMRLSIRLNGLTDRQYAIVEIFYKTMAGLLNSPWTAQASAAIRDNHYRPVRL
jgi:hypothetical protein